MFTMTGCSKEEAVMPGQESAAAALTETAEDDRARLRPEGNVMDPVEGITLESLNGAGKDKVFVDEDLSSATIGHTGIISFSKEFTQFGVGVRAFSDQLEPGSLTALHATAPIGSMILVKNLETDREIQVKVTGRIDQKDGGLGIIVSLSKAAADALKVQFTMFKSEVRYKAPASDRLD
ncbi:MAG: hypothetical protein RL213_721 [Bacteroidota bacterium]|jgi:hypothetical protein